MIKCGWSSIPPPGDHVQVVQVMAGLGTWQLIVYQKETVRYVADIFGSLFLKVISQVLQLLPISLSLEHLREYYYFFKHVE